MLRRLLLTLALLPFPSALQAQAPEPPAGLMANALAELAASSDPRAVDAFVAAHVAASASFPPA